MIKSKTKFSGSKNLGFTGRVLEVNWIDSMSASRWETFDPENIGAIPLVSSWGRLLHEDDESITLAGDWLPDLNGIHSEVNRTMRIPKGCIKQLTPLT